MKPKAATYSGERPSITVEQDALVNPSGEKLVLDDELFIRKSILENPQKGVELLFARYYQVLCTHAIKFVGSRAIAEDLVSELFLQFYANRTFEKIDTSYRAYLFKTVRNRGYNYLKWEAGKQISLQDDFEVLDSEHRQPDQITQYEELYQDYEKAVNSLPLSRRNIYLLFHTDGKSIKEIAAKLNISVRTVDTQIYRASQAIREIIRNKWFLNGIGFLSLFL
ncbi:RNA polymerase sigma-70 factor (ECF subfamily) [Dyadobacter jejuensis]|uniref:RNA polymerase sigma-70 factor (ECF subfamily) n=1 Tax=Dyadobacter jejuensis TaxID=1082580 RepID=A0A316AG47_9BACT|nr:sigma-70 family RNA polymerase sigma factor [Dyadobacter jejuensis]PWJ55940.1 RNA polymerase sigma-70 factor (ECF subfamily) [Dyadobacter jejuensis]